MLKGYTTYKRYYKLIQDTEDDPSVPRRKAAKALARFVDLHDYNIGQKVEIMVEHFRTHTRKVVLDDEVELKYYRLQKVSEGSIDLKAGEPEPLYGPTDVGTGLADEDVQLSALVSKLNDRFGTDFTPADQLFFEQVRETAFENEALKQAAEANSIENFEPVFYKQLENLFVERMDGNEEIFVRLMNDDSFRSIAASHLMRAVYKQFQKARAHGRDASL